MILYLSRRKHSPLHGFTELYSLCLSAQLAPSCFSTTFTVLRSIMKSSQTDQFSIYFRSSEIISSNMDWMAAFRRNNTDLN